MDSAEFAWEVSSIHMGDLVSIGDELFIVVQGATFYGNASYLDDYYIGVAHAQGASQVDIKFFALYRSEQGSSVPFKNIKARQIDQIINMGKNENVGVSADYRPIVIFSSKQYLDFKWVSAFNESAE